MSRRKLPRRKPGILVLVFAEFNFHGCGFYSPWEPWLRVSDFRMHTPSKLILHLPRKLILRREKHRRILLRLNPPTSNRRELCLNSADKRFCERGRAPGGLKCTAIPSTCTIQMFYWRTVNSFKWAAIRYLLRTPAP